MEKFEVGQRIHHLTQPNGMVCSVITLVHDSGKVANILKESFMGQVTAVDSTILSPHNTWVNIGGEYNRIGQVHLKDALPCDGGACCNAEENPVWENTWRLVSRKQAFSGKAYLHIGKLWNLPNVNMDTRKSVLGALKAEVNDWVSHEDLWLKPQEGIVLHDALDGIMQAFYTQDENLARHRMNQYQNTLWELCHAYTPAP